MWPTCWIVHELKPGLPTWWETWHHSCPPCSVSWSQETLPETYTVSMIVTLLYFSFTANAILHWFFCFRHGIATQIWNFYSIIKSYRNFRQDKLTAHWDREMWNSMLTNCQASMECGSIKSDSFASWNKPPPSIKNICP